MATVEKAWTDYKTQWDTENPNMAIPRTKHFQVMNDYIKKMFEEETPEKKQEVEEYRKKLKEEMDEGLDDDQNDNYQTYVTTPTQIRYSISSHTVE
jgi:hypothetical protein